MGTPGRGYLSLLLPAIHCIYQRSLSTYGLTMIFLYWLLVCLSISRPDYPPEVSPGHMTHQPLKSVEFCSQSFFLFGRAANGANDECELFSCFVCFCSMMIDAYLFVSTPSVDTLVLLLISAHPSYLIQSELFHSHCLSMTRFEVTLADQTSALDTLTTLC